MISRIHSMKPLLNRCLIKKIIPQPVTKGGIILSEKSAERDARFGQVVAVGPGQIDDNGKLIAPIVKVGDTVLLPEYQGTKVNMEDAEHEYLIYKDIEILAIVEGVKH
jgi:chaperonin GroES